jgi:small-conductance mechanosensitive channel
VKPLVASVDWMPYAKAGVYLVLTLIAAKVVDWLFSRRYRLRVRVLGRPLALSETSRLRVVRRLAVGVVLFVGIALALVQIPLVGSLARGMIASAGITALVVGLASRSIIANFVSGLIIAVSQPVRIGDIVTIDDVTGTVEEVRLTYTYVTTADTRRVLIPNEQLTSKVIHNYTLVDAVSSAAFDFEVPSSAPLLQVFEVVLEQFTALAPDDEGGQPSLQIAAVTVDAVRLRATVWGDTRQAALARAAAVQEAVVQRLQARGVFGPERGTPGS